MQRSDDGCDMKWFRSFDHITRKTVLNLLEAIYLRFRKTVVDRVTIMILAENKMRLLFYTSSNDLYRVYERDCIGRTHQQWWKQSDRTRSCNTTWHSRPVPCDSKTTAVELPLAATIVDCWPPPPAAAAAAEVVAGVAEIELRHTDQLQVPPAEGTESTSVVQTDQLRLAVVAVVSVVVGILGLGTADTVGDMGQVDTDRMEHWHQDR